MVDIARVGSVSAADFTANIQALSQALETRVRQIENAQERANQQILQSRAIQSRNVQQLRDLNLRAASEGLRVESGPFGQFNVTPTPERAQDLERRRQLEQLQLETRQAQAQAPAALQEITAGFDPAVGPRVPPEQRALAIQDVLERRTDLSQLQKSAILNEFLRRQELRSGIRANQARERLTSAEAGIRERREELFEPSGAGTVPEQLLLEAEEEVAQLSQEEIDATGKSRDAFIRQLAVEKKNALLNDPPSVVTADTLQSQLARSETERRARETTIEAREQALEGAERGEELQQETEQRQDVVQLISQAPNELVLSAKSAGRDVESVEDLFNPAKTFIGDIRVEDIDRTITNAVNSLAQRSRFGSRENAAKAVREVVRRPIRELVSDFFEVQKSPDGTVNLSPKVAKAELKDLSNLEILGTLVLRGGATSKIAAAISDLVSGDRSSDDVLQQLASEGGFDQEDAGRLSSVINLLNLGPEL